MRRLVGRTPFSQEGGWQDKVEKWRSRGGLAGKIEGNAYPGMAVSRREVGVKTQVNMARKTLRIR